MADQEANIIFGTVIDERMGDEVQITVIATGFDSSRKRDLYRPAEVQEESGTAAGLANRDYMRELERQRTASADLAESDETQATPAREAVAVPVSSGEPAQAAAATRGPSKEAEDSRHPGLPAPESLSTGATGPLTTTPTRSLAIAHEHRAGA